MVEFGHVQMPHADLQGTDALEQALLQGAAQAHGLAGGLHLGTQGVAGVGKLIEREPGHLGDDIIDGRLVAGRGGGQQDLIQIQAHADLGGDPGNGIAGGLGGQGGGAGHPGIDLDEVIFRRDRIQGKLDIAAAVDLQGPDQLQGHPAKHGAVRLRQGLGGGHHDGIAGVDAHGIHIFHVADGDGIVAAVAHNLVFDLLVAPDALFHQHLMDRGEGQGVFHQRGALEFIVGKAAAGAAQGEGGAQHHGIADVRRGGQALFQGVGDPGGEDGLSQVLAELFEQVPVLGLPDAGGGGAQQLHAAFLQDPLPVQVHGQIQARLAADAGDDGVRPLMADDPGQIFQSRRLHVDLIRHGGIRHNGGRVGIAQDHLIAFLLQGHAGLGSGVVEFGGLTDDDGAGADDQDLSDVRSLRHKSSLLPFCTMEVLPPQAKKIRLRAAARRRRGSSSPGFYTRKNDLSTG